MTLIEINPRSRLGKEPCGECHLRDGETCDICGAYQMRSNPDIRARARELSRKDGRYDDYDRAVLCILDDLEALLAARAKSAE